MIPEKDRNSSWLLLPLVFSPMILCVLLGLTAMLAGDSASSTCSAFLSQEVLTSMSMMPSRVQEIVLPCPVLAVQLSVALPTAFLIMFLMLRKRPTDNELPAFTFNVLLILLLALAVAYVLWMDIFFVGAFYDVAVGRRAWVFRWLLQVGFISQIAVVAMGWIIVVIYRTARALVAKHSR